jgi:hypothetical protein
MRPGRATEPPRGDARWRRIYLLAAIYTLAIIVLLIGFSRCFAG